MPAIGLPASSDYPISASGSAGCLDSRKANYPAFPSMTAQIDSISSQ